jgi:Domain of unknown function (DUF4277)
MAIAVQQIRPIAHVPLVLGVLRRLELTSLLDDLIPPHPAHVLSTGRGAEALVLAILDGAHALYKGGQRLDERGMVALLQPGLTRASLHAYRLGHIRDARFAANLRRFPRSEILQQSGMRPHSFCPANWMTCDGKVDRFILPSG